MSSFPGVDALLRAAAIGLLLAGCVLVLWPFLTAGLLAGVICIATWPLFRFLRARWLHNSTIAAAFFTTSLAVLVVLPFGVATNAVVDAAPAWIEDVRAWAEQPDHPPPSWLVGLPLLGDWLSDYWQRLAGSREELIKLGQRALEPARSVVLGGGAVVGKGLADLAISLFIAFFFYRDGDQLVSALRTGLSRVAGGFADDVLGTINATVQGVVLGLVGTAAAQAAVALIGFVIVGAPLPWALAASVGVLSIVPAGPPLVWGGVTVWLITQGSLGYAAFMGLWGMFGISGIDNVVKPILISRGSSMPFVLVLTGVFGGLVAFGFVGVFLGPVLLAVGYAAGRRWAGLEGAPPAPPTLTGR